MSVIEGYKKKIIADLDDLIKESKVLLNLEFHDYSQPPKTSEKIRFNSWVMKANQCINSILGKKAEGFCLERIFTEISTKHKNYYVVYINILSENIVKLNSLRESIEKEYIYSLENEIFTAFANDLLSQANRFYKRNEDLAAAIMGRVILEQTMKQALNNNDISYDKNKDTGGQLLAKLRHEANLVDKVEEQNILSLIMIGNKAIHETEVPKRSELKRYLDEIEEKMEDLLGGIFT